MHVCMYPSALVKLYVSITNSCHLCYPWTYYHVVGIVYDTVVKAG